MNPVIATPANRADTGSPRSIARWAGGLYLLNILIGVMVVGIIPALAGVGDQTADVVGRLEAHAELHRIGVAGHLIVVATNIALAILFMELFEVVSRRRSLMLVSFLLVGTAVEASALAAQFIPLVLVETPRYAGAFSSAQVAALARLPLDLQAISYSVSAVFFGLYAVTTATLIWHSTFLPRVVGVLLALAGSSYLIYSFAIVVAPGFAAHLVPWIQLPSLIGEGAFCLTLLLGRVNVQRWRSRAQAPTGHSATAAGLATGAS